jgi:hypothetical protein
MRWIWPDYVCHDLDVTRRERAAIHRTAWRLWWADKRNIALYLLLPAVYALTVLYAADLSGALAAAVGARGAVLKLSRAAGPFVLFLACFAGGGAVLQRYRFAPCVYRAMRLHGHDVCTRCGYWLRGLDEGTACCPECGTEREETQATDE